MKKTLLTLFLIAHLGSASADWDDPLASFSTSDVQKAPMSITWLPVDNVQKVCDAESRKRGGQGFGFSIQACSFWEGSSCTIVTSRRPNMHTLGHEMRHCYQGNWH
jgi:hypothetical protein